MVKPLNTLLFQRVAASSGLATSDYDVAVAHFIGTNWFPIICAGQEEHLCILCCKICEQGHRVAQLHFFFFFGLSRPIRTSPTVMFELVKTLTFQSSCTYAAFDSFRLGISNHDFGHVGGKSLRTIRVFTEWQSRLPGWVGETQVDDLIIPLY